MADDDAFADTQEFSARSYPLVRAGLLALVLLGAVSALLSFPSLVSTDSVRCSIAEQMVDDANDDDDEWNDVDTGGREGDELSCAEAVAAAEQIPVREDGDDFREVPSDGAIRFRGATALVVGAGQLVTGVGTLRTGQRKVRNAAIVFGGLGLIFAVLGLISLIVLTFTVYAITFSSQAQQLWPRRRPPGRRGGDEPGDDPADGDSDGDGEGDGDGDGEGDEPGRPYR